MTILASLARAYERLADRHEVPPFTYATQRIHACIILSETGEMVEPPTVFAYDAKGKVAARSFDVPYFGGRSGKKAPPYFLWDNTAYVLGVSAKDGFDPVSRFEAFRDYHCEHLAKAQSSGLAALRRFLERWEPAQSKKIGLTKDLLDRNLVFRVVSDQTFVHDYDEARSIWREIFKPDQIGQGRCLVTGERAPIARLHPPIGSFENPARIVSFDKDSDAFASYGKMQGANAPVGIKTAAAYTAVLNKFLADDYSRNRLQVGDASTVFWADATEVDAEAAIEAEDIFRDLVAEGGSEAKARRKADAFAESVIRVDEGGQADRVGAALLQIRAGRPGDLDLGLAEGVRFHVLGLAPNAARLSVRFWLDDTFGDVARRYAAHVDRMRVAPPPRDATPSIWRCLVETATLRKSENIPPNLAGDWLRAILTGAPYPLTILTTLLMRLRADKDVNALRAAMLKAVLMRNFGYTEKEAPVALDTDNTDSGYLLGRLFATYERIQTDALPGLNATIRDKFYGAASATPRKVFTLLDRGSANHLAKIAKDSKGRAVNLEKVLGAIMARLVPGADPFPAFLSTEQQALFPLGYYHQKSEFFRRRDPAPSETAPVLAPTDAEETAL